MNWLDIVLIAILTLSTLMSARKGFSREIIGLVAAVVALVAAIFLYERAGSFIAPYVSSPAIAWLAGFLSVLFGVIILGAILSAIVSRFLKTIGLSFFDRLLGAVFGLARGALVGIGIILTLVAFTPGLHGSERPEAVVHSRVAPYLIEMSSLFAKLAPQDLRDSFERHYEQVKSSWQTGAEKRD